MIYPPSTVLLSPYVAVESVQIYFHLLHAQLIYNFLGNDHRFSPDE